MSINRLGTVGGHWDTMDEGPLPEPYVYVAGHKVYRKESCTLDHKPVPARCYMGLWQCRCCDGIIVPSLRRKRTIYLAAYKHNPQANGNGHTNGNGRHAA